MDTTRTRVSLAALVFLISGLFGCTPVAAQYGGVIGTAQIDRANSKTSWFGDKLRVSVRVRTKPSHLSPIIESLSTIRYFASFADRKIDAKAFQSFDIPHDEARTSPRRTMIFESDAANIPNQRYINIEFQACWSTRHGKTKGAALVGRSTCKTDQALIALPFNGRPKSKPVAQQAVNGPDGASIAAHEPLTLTVDKFTTTSSLLYFDATLSGVTGFPQSSFTLTAAGREFIARRITPRKNKLASYKASNIMLPLDLIGTQLHVMTVKNPGRPDIASLRVEFSQYGNRAQHVAATAVLAPKLIMTGMIDEDVVGGAGIDSVATLDSGDPCPSLRKETNPTAVSSAIENQVLQGSQGWSTEGIEAALDAGGDPLEKIVWCESRKRAFSNVIDWRFEKALTSIEWISEVAMIGYVVVKDEWRADILRVLNDHVDPKPDPIIEAIAFHGDGQVANLVKVRLSEEPRTDTEVELAWNDSNNTKIATLTFTPINWETWQIKSIEIPSIAGGSEGGSASMVVASIGNSTASIKVKGIDPACKLSSSECDIDNPIHDQDGWHVALVGSPNKMILNSIQSWNMPVFTSPESIVDIGGADQVNVTCDNSNSCTEKVIVSCFDYVGGSIIIKSTESVDEGNIDIDGNCWVYWDGKFTVSSVPSTQ